MKFKMATSDLRGLTLGIFTQRPVDQYLREAILYPKSQKNWGRTRKKR